MHKNKIGVLASCTLLALSIGACGKSKSSSTSSTGTGSGTSATISGAGSTFAAPIYEQWGSKVLRA